MKKWRDVSYDERLKLLNIDTPVQAVAAETVIYTKSLMGKHTS